MYCGIWRYGDFNNWYQNGFLYSPIKETIYLKRPPGLSPNIIPSLVKSNKCPYGLRQAAHEWRKLLDSTLNSFGFIQLETDTCVYKLTVIDQNINGTLILGIFIEDILCLGDSKSLIQWFQSLLSEKFSITIKSDVESSLGIHVTRNHSTKCISLSQPGYISSLISRFQVDTSSYPTCSMSSLDLQDSQNVPK